MLLAAERPLTNSYAVEVSGWDSTHSFFVEKCELEWNEATGKCIVLSHLLPPSSMIFLRLLQSSSPERSLPVAYRAHLHGVAPEGWHRFRLNQIQPNCNPRMPA